MQISRNREEKTIFLNQEKLITKGLTKFGFSKLKGPVTPMEHGQKLVPIDEEATDQNCPSDDEEDWPVVKANTPFIGPYREMLGLLLYISGGSRPEISFAVGQLSQFCNNPSLIHWEALKRVLQYLAGTLNYGINLDGADIGELK